MWRFASIALVLVFMLATAIPCGAADVWQLRFAPKRNFRLSINDLKFASSTHGVAVGRIVEGRNSKPISVFTSDGGRTWQMASTPEAGLSLFFVDGVGWMVTESGLWKTSDAGRTWEKLAVAGFTAGGVTQVYFLDPNRGWAVGRPKAMYRTNDGGLSWTPVGAAAEAPGSLDNTSFDCITFVGGRFGLAAGASFPPQTKEKERQRELPHLTIFLDTRDAGETWKASTTSMFGRVTRIQFAPDGRGLGLIEFRRDFDYPSEVFSIEWKTGKSNRAFRRADSAVTDIALLPDGQAWLAAIDAGGRGPSEGARGRVKFLHSTNLLDWTEAQVNGRQLGRKVFLSVKPDGELWSATDEGMILQFVPDSKQEQR